MMGVRGLSQNSGTPGAVPELPNSVPELPELPNSRTPPRVSLRLPEIDIWEIWEIGDGRSGRSGRSGTAPELQF